MVEKQDNQTVEGEDVKRLLELLDKFNSGTEKRVRGPDQYDAIHEFLEYDWPEKLNFSDADLSHGGFEGKNFLCGCTFSDRRWNFEEKKLKDNEGKAANLKRANLKGANLTYSHLEGVTLNHAELNNAELNNARLEGATLDDANLKDAKLNFAHLEGAKLNRVHLEDAELNNAHLEGTILRYAHLKRAKLNFAHLDDAKLDGSHLENTELNNAELKGAKLNGAHLDDAELNNAHLDRAELKIAHLKRTKLNNANLKKAKLKNAELNNAELKGAQLQGAELNEAILEGAILVNAHLEGALLKNTNLKGAKLKGAHLEGAKFDGAIISGANFTNAIFTPFRLPHTRTSKSSGTWRIKAVANQAGNELCKSFLAHVGDSDDDEEEDDDDEDEDDDDDDDDDDEDDTDDGNNDNDDNNDEEAQLIHGHGDDIISHVVEHQIKTYVDRAVRVIKPVISTVNLTLEMLKRAMDVSFTLLKNDQELTKAITDNTELNEQRRAVKGYIIKKFPNVVKLMVEKLIIDSIDTCINILHDPNKATTVQVDNLLNRLLIDYKNIIEVNYPPEDGGSDDDLVGQEVSLEMTDCVNEFCDLQEEVGEHIDPAVKEFVKGMVNTLRTSLSETLETATEETLRTTLKESRNNLGNNLGEEFDLIEAMFAPIQKKLQIFLGSGLEDLSYKLLNNHSQEQFQYLAKMTKSHIKLAERYEQLLIDKSNDFDVKIKNKFEEHFPKHSVRARLVKSMLRAATKYSIKIGDKERNLDTLLNAVRISRVELNTIERELTYLLDKLVKIEEMDVTVEKWRDAAQTWMSAINLRKDLKAERSIAVINCIANDKTVLEALGAAATLLHTSGGSDSIVSILSTRPGGHIRKNGYRYQRAIRQEIARIQKIREFQVLVVSFIGTAIASALIALFNNIFHLAGENFTSWWNISLIAIAIIVAFFLILSCCVLCCKRYNNKTKDRIMKKRE